MRGEVRDILDDGASVNLLPGINGLLPKSQISHEFVENVNDHLQIGQQIKVKVEKIDDRGCVLSLKALYRFEPEFGKVYMGNVNKILDDVAFVSLTPGIEGLLNKSEIGHGPIENINDNLQIGQQIKAKVIETDDSGLVLLSTKALVSSEPELGKAYMGEVRRILDYGAFVSLLPRIEGMLHISEIAHWFIEDINYTLQMGQRIKVKVIEIDDSGDVWLSMRALCVSEPKLGKVYMGKINRILDYWAIVGLLPGIKGLLHISEIAHGSIENINDHLQIGLQIKVKVIETDDSGLVLLSLSTKALVSSEPELGMVYEGKIKKILDYGAIVRLPHGFDGRLFISEIAHKFVANINDHLQIGQQIKVKVIKISRSGRVLLSMKEVVSSKPEPAEVHGLSDKISGEPLDPSGCWLCPLQSTPSH